MIKLYLDVSDVMHANLYTKHANCGLHVNFWNFSLMSFYFMMKKDCFEHKPQAHFKEIKEIINP